MEEAKKVRDAERAAQPKPVVTNQVPFKTLFVRNISYDTDQATFNEFMSRFGPVKYAVLVKPKQLQGESNEL